MHLLMYVVDLYRRSKLLTEKSLQDQFYVIPHISPKQQGRKSFCFCDQHSFSRTVWVFVLNHPCYYLWPVCRMESSNYDQVWLHSWALCAGFAWGIENLHPTSMKPAVQSLMQSVLCSTLFGPCLSCTLDQELLTAKCALCYPCPVALCNCRVPSHG